MQLVYGAQERLSDTARGMKGGCSGVCLEEHSWRVDLAFRWHCTGHCQKLSIPRPPSILPGESPKGLWDTRLQIYGHCCQSLSLDPYAGQKKFL